MNSLRKGGLVLAIVAPGQGSQVPGFLQPWLELPHFEDRLRWLGTVAGIDLVVKQFDSALNAVGVQAVAAVGQPFDPYLHQAMAEQESDTHKPGTVMQAWTASWTLHGRLLRPADSGGAVDDLACRLGLRHGA